MKRLLYFAFFILGICELTFAQSLDNAIFHPIEGTEPSVAKVGLICTETEHIDIASLPILTSLAISGSVEYDDYKYGFVRVILIDKNNDEYLIMEENKLFTKDKKFTFSPTSIETRLLDNVCPMQIKVISFHATISIDFIYYTDSNDLAFNKDIEDAAHKQQIAYWCDLWNNYNKEHHQHWYASVDESDYRMTYSRASKMFGRDESYIPDGMELYAGGIFVIRDYFDDKPEHAKIAPKKAAASVTSNYVESFDWRNRHGRNWMTPIKNQKLPVQHDTIGNGGCWAFTACAAVESAYQLYFNRITNIDLSEQELGSCTSEYLRARCPTSDECDHGGDYVIALSYIKQTGVMLESDFPFENDYRVPCTNKSDNPAEVVHISNYRSVTITEENLKMALIQYGPMCSAVYNMNYQCNDPIHPDWEECGCNHAVLLVGYNTIHEGDTIDFFEALANSASGTIETIIGEDDELIGQTYWIFKNSSGINGTTYQGYSYFVFENFSRSVRKVYEIINPIFSSIYDTNDIICEDRDGDGYYFWGLGPKPAHCPACAPDEPDGDDSNPEIGPINSYGFPLTYIDPAGDTIISTNTTITNRTLTSCDHIHITNNAVVTITSTGKIQLNGHNKIIVESGTLLIDGGIIDKARIEVEDGGTLILQNNGTISLGPTGYFTIEDGGELNQIYGEITL